MCFGIERPKHRTSRPYSGDIELRLLFEYEKIDDSKLGRSIILRCRAVAFLTDDVYWDSAVLNASPLVDTRCSARHMPFTTFPALAVLYGIGPPTRAVRSL